MAGLVRVRPSVEHANIPVLADAYKKMQARSEKDNRSWIFWAKYHGFNRFDCWHHGSVGSQGFPYDLFLPWHRAYLLYFEQVVAGRQRRGDPPVVGLDVRKTSHNSGIPPASKQTIDKILNLLAFDDFCNQVQNQHDRVHGWVGGDMGVVATSTWTRPRSPCSSTSNPPEGMRRTRRTQSY